MGVLDKAMFEGAVFLHLRHIPQRGWVADASQVGRRSGHGVKQHGEATVDLVLQQPPGGGSLLCVVSMVIVVRRVVATIWLATIQLSDVVEGVDGDSREMRPRDDVLR